VKNKILVFFTSMLILLTLSRSGSAQSEAKTSPSPNKLSTPQKIKKCKKIKVYPLNDAVSGPRPSKHTKPKEICDDAFDNEILKQKDDSKKSP